MKPFDIADPCHESWDAMRQTQGARHCASCDKHVVDLARLTEAQIRGLLTLTGGNMCARQTIRDGALVTLPPARVRSRFPIRLALGGAVVASALAACAPAHAAGPEPARDPIVVVQVGDPVPDPQSAPIPTLEPPDDFPIMGGLRAPDPTVDDFQINFEKNSSKLTKEAEQQVLNAASALAVTPWVAHVRIEGYVSKDEIGRKAQGLALARAVVVQALFVKQGIDPARLSVVAVTKASSVRRVIFVIDTTK